MVTLAGAELDRLTTAPPEGAGSPRVKLPVRVDAMPTSELGSVIVMGGDVMLNALLVADWSVPLVAVRT
jgi:hypothetical protein